MGRKRTWDDVVVKRVMRLVESGMSYRRIADVEKITLAKVQRILSSGPEKPA